MDLSYLKGINLCSCPQRIPLVYQTKTTLTKALTLAICSVYSLLMRYDLKNINKW
jgi:hypothetical protein